jgi:hypothetical protein
MRAAQGLAINGNQISVSHCSDRVNPGDEALLEFGGVQFGKNIAKGIPFGNSKKVRSQTTLASPHSSISVKCSAPQIVAKMAMAMMSINSSTGLCGI